jgi:hypothetical protein
MGGARKHSQEFLLRVVLFGVLAIGLMSCAALPRGSVDPLDLILGLPRAEKGAAQPPGEAPAPAGAPGPR